MKDCGLDTTLYILAGVPGCGKSTFAKMMLPDIKVASSDQIRRTLFDSLVVANAEENREANNRRVFGLYHSLIRETLQRGHSVVADATNLDAESRKYLRKIASDEGAKVVLVIFHNTGQAIQRNKKRDLDSAVPHEVQKRMLGKYWDTLGRIPYEKYDQVIEIGGMT